MCFTPYRSKEAQEVIFSRKSKNLKQPPSIFDNNCVFQTFSQKIPGWCITLDSRLRFEDHLGNALAKVNKTIGLLRTFWNSLPRITLITLYKAFIRPHLDYGDILHDQAFNISFKEKLESEVVFFLEVVFFIFSKFWFFGLLVG